MAEGDIKKYKTPHFTIYSEQRAVKEGICGFKSSADVMKIENCETRRVNTCPSVSNSYHRLVKSSTFRMEFVHMELSGAEGVPMLRTHFI